MEGSSETESGHARELKFRGGRFDLKGIHVNGLEELIRYQKLVQEVGKDVWREGNGSNLPVPRTVADNLQLRMLKFKDGSVDTQVIPEFTSFLDYDEPDYTALALQRVDEIFKQVASGNDIQHVFSESSVGAFKELGQGFKGDEFVEFSGPGFTHLTYTRQLRRRAIKSIDAGLKLDRHRLLGRITRLNTSAATFTFELAKGRQVSGKAGSYKIVADLKNVLDLPDTNVLVLMDCQARSRGTSGPILIDEVYGVEVFISDSEDSTRLIELASIPDGWLDGSGASVCLLALEMARDILGLLRNAKLPQPAIFPCPNGGVNIEWLSSVLHVVIEIDPEAELEGYTFSSKTENFVEQKLANKEEVITFALAALNG